MFIESKAFRVMRRAAELATAFVLVGCAGTLDDPERFLDGSSTVRPGASPVPSACGDVPTTLFVTRCATAGCHDATTSTAGLDLASPDLAARIRGKSAAGGAGVLLDPTGDPQKSVLYLKVTSAPPFGSRMPLGGSLSDDDVACVGAWIASAATSSTPPTPVDGSTPLDTGVIEDAGAGLDGADAVAPRDP